MGHGGKRPGAGRKKGSRNKATDEQLGTITEMAQAHSEDAIRTLLEIAGSGSSDAARVSAANALLDRGYGKPPQALHHSGDEDIPKTAVINLTIGAEKDDSRNLTRADDEKPSDNDDMPSKNRTINERPFEAYSSQDKSAQKVH